MVVCELIRTKIVLGVIMMEEKEQIENWLKTLNELIDWENEPKEALNKDNGIL